MPNSVIRPYEINIEMNNITWSKREKNIARQAYNKAL